MSCISPPHWNQQYTTQLIDFEVTLNGQDYLQAVRNQAFPLMGVHIERHMFLLEVPPMFFCTSIFLL